eukprot:92523-Chlamydomonas_euryale.AAC.1
MTGKGRVGREASRDHVWCVRVAGEPDGGAGHEQRGGAGKGQGWQGPRHTVLFDARTTGRGTQQTAGTVRDRGLVQCGAGPCGAGAMRCESHAGRVPCGAGPMRGGSHAGRVPCG